jgi:transposase
MRKSFDALSGLVRTGMGRNPLSGEVFLFLNKNRTHLKLLHWESGGLVLYYKRLEKGRFPLPHNPSETGPITWADLVLMIEGITVLKSRKAARFSVEK